MSSAGRASTGVALVAALGLLGGCGGADRTAPSVTVQAGGDEISVDPTQYCLDGDGRRYQTAPPIIEVPPDTPVLLTVPAEVAGAGWSVQVFDEQLEQLIGEVDVPEGDAQFTEINTSDVVPPAFYLVVVEDSDPDACSGLSGAWPVGFIRAEGTSESTSPTPAG